MPRQNKDGSTPGDKHKHDYESLFENPVTGLIGAWDWAECNTRLLAEAFTVVNTRGDLMSLATNANNTAGAVTIISGGAKRRLWLNTHEEADALFAQLAALAPTR